MDHMMQLPGWRYVLLPRDMWRKLCNIAMHSQRTDVCCVPAVDEDEFSRAMWLMRQRRRHVMLHCDSGVQCGAYVPTVMPTGVANMSVLYAITAVHRCVRGGRPAEVSYQYHFSVMRWMERLASLCDQRSGARCQRWAWRARIAWQYATNELRYLHCLLAPCCYSSARRVLKFSLKFNTAESLAEHVLMMSQHNSI